MNSLPKVFPFALRRGLALTGLAAFVAFSSASVAQEKAKLAVKSTAPTTAAKTGSVVKGASQTPPAGTTVVEQKYRTNVKGSVNAPIQVVEFADFMCPGCQAASQALRSYFAQQGDDISLTFKNFPLELTCNPGIGRTVHNGACELALGSVCASELGYFWAYHDRIFSRSWEVATRQDVLDNGTAVGMNKAKFEACLNSPEASSKLALQVKEGFEAKVQITPTLVVNGKKLAATNEFASAVEAERKKIASPAAPTK